VRTRSALSWSGVMGKTDFAKGFNLHLLGKGAGQNYTGL
jgi:hypothetical protein